MNYDMSQFRIDDAKISHSEKVKCLCALCEFEPDYVLPGKIVDAFWCREALAQRLIREGISLEDAIALSELIRKGLFNENSHPEVLNQYAILKSVEPILYKAIGRVRYLTYLERCKEYLSTNR